MNTPIRILGIAGSLRRGSYNRAALRAAAELAPKGATVETFDLDGIPPFNQDEEQNPPAKVTQLKRRIREADAILFVTPEYNWSVSGVLKNAIDWASRPHGDTAWNGFDQEGNLTDVPTRAHIIGLLQSLMDWTRHIGLK